MNSSGLDKNFREGFIFQLGSRAGWVTILAGGGKRCDGRKNRAGEGPEEGQVLGTANAVVRLGMREKKK